jgi:thymidylate synthase
MINVQDEYRGLLSEVLYEGKEKNDRTGTGTKSVFGRILRHNMELGFPLLTAKKIYFNHAITELLWILQGRNDMYYLRHHGVTYWDDNYEKSGRTDNTLGPVYGKQLRDFDGVDQLKWVLEQIKQEPSSRRIMASLWNPVELDDMALPPCHYGFQVYINENKLSLAWSQRSVDVFLGLPYDIAMYGLLLLMLAKGTGYEPGELVCFLGDCHLYNNHIEQSIEYLNRADKLLPTVELKKGLSLTHEVVIPTHEDITLINYSSASAIKAPLAT